jgi:cellulose synthase/poly-beta-1,6-N-acetylglucosamine synthase-like glycosyltransferase
VFNTSLLYAIFLASYYVIFVGLHLALMLGIFLEWRRDRRALKNVTGALPTVSVIVPVQNESRRIEGLLRSLAAQDYPNAEVIFVDDRSRDESVKLITEFMENRGGLKGRIITLKENPGPNCKQYALARGIEVSSAEFLLFTDADCQVPSGWIGAMVKRLSDEKTGAAIGPVLKRLGGKGFFHLYQCYEHGVRYVYLAGAAGLGAAGGGFGNNLILRRACLDAVGGYDNIPPSPTEDAALISKIRSCSKYKVRAALGPDVHVITQGEDCWKNLINQTLRWNNGGIFCPDLGTRINYSFLMITITMGVLAFPFLPFIPSIWPLPLGPVTVMVFNTIANLVFLGVSLPRRRFCFGYLLTLLFMPVYMALMTIMGYLGIKPKWKGERV